MHTRVHKIYFSLHKTYGVHEICFGVHEVKFETYLNILELQMKSKKKSQMLLSVILKTTLDIFDLQMKSKIKKILGVLWGPLLF